MTDKSNFTPDEWKLILESVMMAGIAVSAAEPSGLWGLSKESFAGGTALVTANGPRIEPADQSSCRRFRERRGRALRATVEEELTGSNPGRSRPTDRDVPAGGQWATRRRRAMLPPSRAGCARSASTLPRQPRRADFSALAACR